MTNAPREERSLGDLFAELSQQVSTLVRKEFELARHELTRSATRLGRAAALIAVGGLLAYAGLIVLLIGLGFLLATLGLPTWLALLVVGIAVVAIGGFLAWHFLNEMKKTAIVPERTVETIQDNVQWAKEQTE
ncbi:MAG TPA: phage holin family protein [Candidatus Limnocylindrales bacterium]|nr:phage holin family protein [Candidatus Limnocylindrales bacterium]